MSDDTISIARDMAHGHRTMSADQAGDLLLILANELEAARATIKDLETFVVECEFCGERISIADTQHFCDESRDWMIERRRTRALKRTSIDPSNYGGTVYVTPTKEDKERIMEADE